jgi:hypothetical protein
MATHITKAAFARLVGVSRAAITAAVKTNRLIAEPDGKIDPDSPSAQEYAEFQRTATKATGAKGAGRPVANGTADPVAPSILQATAAGKMPIPQAENIAAQGKQLVNRLNAVKLAQKKLEYLEQTKKVIPVDIVAMAIGRISAMLDENFRAFDERNSDELFDLARSADKLAFAAALGKRIDESMKAALDGVRRDVKNLIRQEGA